ncbi:MAG: hypothetical protein A2Y62_09490 [Candidatus Fischerbacteria bacterium RBG_13_37_8]|uniref:Uncharacterized protein n=1 Tax=Candidatus Fischerbacteria bacterium RBG_13_37_8 TaxID=1817863 RepID=A0A1F5VJW8_9BACT|nr:MAG: hypothetical protein A2Y62_09490 [Candidatus Fischerbacteria bacterium RBG_13_37_8]
MNMHKKTFILLLICGSLFLKILLSDNPSLAISHSSYYDNNPLISVNGFIFTINHAIPSIPENLQYKNAPGYNYFLLKFKARVHAEWKSELKQLGVTLYDYIPVNTYIIKAHAESLEQIKRKPYV